MSDDEPPPVQPSLFDSAPRARPKLDAERATVARNAALGVVGGDADDTDFWRAEYCAEIRRFASHGFPFLAEDVSAVVGIPEKLDPRAIGPLFLAAQREGVIVPTGRVLNGKAVSRHRAPMREWIGANRARS